MACRISRAMTITHTARAITIKPAMIQPIVTEVPMNNTNPSEMPPIHMKQEASRRIRIFDGWKEEINID